MKTAGIAWAESSHSKTPHDDLRLPDGRAIGDVKDVTSILVDLDIPGCAHANGRAANVAAYAAHLQKIHDAAGRAAVASWLKERAPVA